MSKKVVYYTDKPNDKFPFGPEVMHAIHKYLDVQEFVSMHAKTIAGFESGVNWEDLKKQGFVAVVVYKANNDATVLGIFTEAENAGLKVYEIYPEDDGLLYELKHLSIMSQKKAVLGLSPEHIAASSKSQP